MARTTLAVYDEAFAVDQLERLMRQSEEDRIRDYVKRIQSFVTESLRHNLNRRPMMDAFMDPAIKLHVETPLTLSSKK